MQTLSDEQNDQLRTALETERARILRNAQDGLSFSMNRDRNIGRDSIDESMEEEIFSTELRLRDREKFLLGKINGALQRLDEKTINECEDCGDGGEACRLHAVAFRAATSSDVNPYSGGTGTSSIPRYV